MGQQKSFPYFQSVLRWTGCFGGTILKYDFRLSQESRQSAIGPEKDQRCNCRVPVHNQFAISQKLLIIPIEHARIAAPLRPALTKPAQGFRRQIIDGGLANFRREIRSTFCKHRLQLGPGYRYQIVSGATQIAAIVLPSRSRQAPWDMYNKYASALMLNFFNRYSLLQSVIEACLRPARLPESLRPDDLTWSPITHTQNNLSAALIGKGDTVVRQSFKSKIIPGGLELQVQALRLGKPLD